MLGEFDCSDLVAFFRVSEGSRLERHANDLPYRSSSTTDLNSRMAPLSLPP